jgi:glycerophosphoryl diester phosphodiesterase
MGHGQDRAAGACNPWGIAVRKPVEIIAHRGANRESLENTIPAFQKALEIGVQGIELDVHLSRDGIPVVHHDPALPPVQPDMARPLIASLAVAELQERSAVPTLDQVLNLVNGRCRVYVEIKAPAAVESVVELLASRGSWCAVHSFDHRVVARARALDPELEAGILLASYLLDPLSAMRAADARDLWQRTEFVDGELIQLVHGAGGRVVAWTVNDLDRAAALADLGVDAICTDAPRELLAGLREAS